jgi:hypothetical protein
MKIRPVGAEWFHADPRIDGHADRHGEARGRCLHFYMNAPSAWKVGI